MNAMPERADAAMTDLSFALTAHALPIDYRAPLWLALCAHAPWLAATPAAGAHGLRAAHDAATRTLLLPRRARLMLRVAACDALRSMALAGTRLVVDGVEVMLGEAHERPLRAADTLYAEIVATGSSDELHFTEEVRAALDAMNVEARIICGRARVLHGAAGDDDPARDIAGFPLALHGLKPDASLRVQCAGIGNARALGCGLFVPHKAITGLD